MWQEKLLNVHTVISPNFRYVSNKCEMFGGFVERNNLPRPTQLNVGTFRCIWCILTAWASMFHMGHLVKTLSYCKKCQKSKFWHLPKPNLGTQSSCMRRRHFDGIFDFFWEVLQENWILIGFQIVTCFHRLFLQNYSAGNWK